jgi:cyanate lyase
VGSSSFLWAGASLSRFYPSVVLISAQAKFSEAELEDIAGALGIEWIRLRDEIGSHWWPHRGLGPMPPTDPVIYRLYEVCHAMCKVFNGAGTRPGRPRIWRSN